MGHASITVTLDRYGHRMPGSESDAAALLDGELAAAQTSPTEPLDGAAVGRLGPHPGGLNRSPAAPARPMASDESR